MTLTEMKSWLDENGIEYSGHDYARTYKVPDSQFFIQKCFPFLAPKKQKTEHVKS